MAAPAAASASGSVQSAAMMVAAPAPTAEKRDGAHIVREKSARIALAAITTGTQITSSTEILNSLYAYIGLGVDEDLHYKVTTFIHITSKLTPEVIDKTVEGEAVLQAYPALRAEAETKAALVQSSMNSRQFAVLNLVGDIFVARNNHHLRQKLMKLPQIQQQFMATLLDGVAMEDRAQGPLTKAQATNLRLLNTGTFPVAEFHAALESIAPFIVDVMVETYRKEAPAPAAAAASAAAK